MSDLVDDFKGTTDIPAVMISIDHQVTEGRIIRFSTGIAQDAPPEEFNALLDKLGQATDRQAAKYELVKLKQMLEREEKLYVQQTEDLLRIDAEHQAQWGRTHKGEFKLTGAQLKDRENAEISIARRRDSIKHLREMIAQNTAVANANGAAISH